MQKEHEMLVLYECLNHSMEKLIIYISWMLVSGWVMFSLRGMQECKKSKTETQEVFPNPFTLRVTKLWHRFPREAVASSASEVLKSHLEMAPTHPAGAKIQQLASTSLFQTAFCASVISYHQTCFLYSWGKVSVLWILTPGFRGRNISFKIICFFQSIVLFSVSHH